MLPAARVGDDHFCPMIKPIPIPHKGGPVLQGEPTVLIGGLPAARKGDSLTCIGDKDMVKEGESTVLIGGKPAARMGDGTQHGGRIVKGDTTVLIGQVARGSQDNQSGGLGA